MTITKINPDSLHRSPAFDQGIVVEPGSRLLFIGGQNGVDGSGAIIGTDTRSQTERALKNLLAVLADVGADQDNVVKMTIYLAEEADLNEGFAASATVWGQHTTTITVLRVAGIANPGCLVEIDAVAAI